MTNKILAAIRAAIEAGPLAAREPLAGESTAVDPTSARPTAVDSTGARPMDARLIDAQQDRAGLLDRFAERARSSGAEVHAADDVESLRVLLARIIPAGSTVGITHRSEISDRLGIAPEEIAPGVLAPDVFLHESCRSIEPWDADRDELFRIEAALTGVESAIAETGSIVLEARPDHARLASLVAPVHVVLIWPDQIDADLLDWAKALTEEAADHPARSRTVITGPSKTADIELKLVIGVHGPSTVHFVLMNDRS